MNTAKHWRDSNLQPLPKRQFRSWIKSYIPLLLLSSLLGTYLDLLMIGQQLYSFPIRPFPAIFSINLLITLAGLPVSTLIFIVLMNMRKNWVKACIVIFYSLGMAVLEKKAEDFGLFVHTSSWSHWYTFAGYCVFLIVVYRFHEWMQK